MSEQGDPNGEYQQVEIDGSTVAYLEQGTGPLVLLLHGYPDTARGWLPVMQVLADAGYRAVAPSLPGYPPSGHSPDGDYSAARNAEIMLGLVDELGADRFYLCGLDWGYFIAFAVAHLDPSSVAKLAAGHAHPKKVGFTDLRVTWSARHAVMHQIPRLAMAITQRNDFAYIDKLYRRWSPNWNFTAADTAEAKATLAQPGVLREALQYYRDQLQAELLPSGKRSRRLLKQRTRVPTLIFRGLDDPMAVDKWFESSPALFLEGCEVVNLDGVGHFPHREDPGRFASMLLEFFGPASEAPR